MNTNKPSRLAVLALAPFALFALALTVYLVAELPVRIHLPWIPSLGIDASLHIDGWALQFVLLITGIGGFVLLYAAGYLAGDPKRKRVFVLLLAFMAAMLGSVSADNLIVLFVFWELTGLTSFLLVGTKHEDATARASARQALVVTGGGGLVMLAGFILLGQVAGTFSISELISSGPAWINHQLVPLALACIFVGAFSKSAQFPFHFWLPNAMSAPTPVSAYLHSATMVKLGIYLLGRLHPAFDEMVLWQVSLITVGVVTSVLAMLLTLRERDLKRILAWSTVAALGTLVMLIGQPGDGAAMATSAFLLAHALYKAPLFFVAGNVDHAAGTRNIDHLSRLARAMPLSAVAALLAAISMAGMPLSFGFIAKDLIELAKYDGQILAWASYASMFVSAMSVAVAGVAAIRVFWQHNGDASTEGVHEGGPLLWLPPLMVAGLGIVLGLVPHLVGPLIGAAAESMRPALQHGELRILLGGYVLVSLITATVIGLAFFLAWDRLHELLERGRELERYSPSAWYDLLMRAIPAAANWLTLRLQHGSLVGYTAMLLVAGVLAILPALAFWTKQWPAFDPPSLAVVGVSLLLVVAAIAACRVRDSFVLLLTSGLVGFGSALLFLFLGAPDLAMTQFAVEVAFVVVIVAILLRVRKLDLKPAPVHHTRTRAVMAVVVGTVIAALVLAATAVPFDPVLKQFFAERAVPDAHGRNVVNVVLVDFRAVDTLGEIAVVGASFIATIPLLLLVRARLAKSRRNNP